MHQVFISYSSKNSAIADAVCHRLESDNVRCWYAPRDVQAGIGWAGQLTRAIRESKVFLLIYSEDFNNSVQVISELTEAVDAGCTIVPFRVDQTEMNDDLAYYLKKVHWLDAVNPPTTQHINNLYNHVARILEINPEPVPPPPPVPDRKKHLSRFFRKPFAMTVVSACLVGILCAVCLRPAAEPTPEQVPETLSVPADTQNMPETIPEPTYQTMNFVNLSRLPKFKYPFLSSGMLSSDGEFIMLQNLETNRFTLGRTDIGSVYLSNIPLEYTNPRMMEMCLTDNYHTIYFIDNTQKKISSYDRVKNQWINHEGTILDFSDTEFIYTTFSFDTNMFSDNSHKEELVLFVYDTAPEADCFSKAIYVSPDGKTATVDISQHQFVQLITGIDTAECNGVLALDSANNLRVFESSTGKLLELSHKEILQDYLPHIQSKKAFSEDLQYFLSTQSNGVQVWNLNTGSQVYSRIFADFSCVYFSDPHEIIAYNNEDQRVFIHDLETGRETVIMDQEYFNNNPVFMDSIVQFLYSDEYDICIFAAAANYDEETGEGLWRIVITDRKGRILAVSNELKTYHGSNRCYLNLLDSILLAEMTPVNWATIEPEDGIITELFRAQFTVDENGNLVFE